MGRAPCSDEATPVTSYVLDTHVLVWWIEANRKLPAATRRMLDRESRKAPLWVADISLWEIAALQEAGRVRFSIPLRDWLEAAVAEPLVAVHPITPAIVSELGSLPSWDPADRLIVATARVLGATLVTLDERIRESGLVPVAPA
jgi:PIN domain nuclease of toxin-antitoxin system